MDQTFLPLSARYYEFTKNDIKRTIFWCHDGMILSRGMSTEMPSSPFFYPFCRLGADLGRAKTAPPFKVLCPGFTVNQVRRTSNDTTNMVAIANMVPNGKRCRFH